MPIKNSKLGPHNNSTASANKDHTTMFSRLAGDRYRFCSEALADRTHHVAHIRWASGNAVVALVPLSRDRSAQHWEVLSLSLGLLELFL